MIMRQTGEKLLESSGSYRARNRNCSIDSISLFPSDQTTRNRMSPRSRSGSLLQPVTVNTKTGTVPSTVTSVHHRGDHHHHHHHHAGDYQAAHIGNSAPTRLVMRESGHNHGPSGSTSIFDVDCESLCGPSRQSSLNIHTKVVGFKGHLPIVKNRIPYELLHKRRGLLCIQAWIIATFMAALFLFYSIFPERLNYVPYKVPFSPDCIVLHEGFDTGGNFNRLTELFNAFHLIKARNMKYLALPKDWQEWACEWWSQESVENFPVSVIPESGDFSCPRLFKIPHEQEHQEYWDLLVPTASNYMELAQKRLKEARETSESGLVVTVHKRFLYRNCGVGDAIADKWCHYLPDDIRRYAKEAGVDLDKATVIVSSDGVLPEEDEQFPPQWKFNDDPFISQIWLMTLSDFHIGNPNSSMDRTICKWRCTQCLGCRTCSPDALGSFQPCRPYPADP